MKLLIVATAAIASLISFSSSALAQERVPDRALTAAGFDVGVFIPRSDSPSSSVLLNGNVRVLRHAPGQRGRGCRLLESRLQHRRRRFIDAGAAYFQRQLQLGTRQMASLRRRRDRRPLPSVQTKQPSTDNTDTKVGFNTGGGIEYFLNRTLAVKGEGRYHALGDVRGEQTSGTALTVGVKNVLSDCCCLIHW